MRTISSRSSDCFWPILLKYLKSHSPRIFGGVHCDRQPARRIHVAIIRRRLVTRCRRLYGPPRRSRRDASAGSTPSRLSPVVPVNRGRSPPQSAGNNARTETADVAAQPVLPLRMPDGLGPDERQEISVDRLGFCGRHAVWEALVGFQRAILQQFGAQRRGVGVRHDLIIVAMHHKGRDRDLL